jgi:hypothetical protein
MHRGRIGECRFLEGSCPPCQRMLGKEMRLIGWISLLQWTETVEGIWYPRGGFHKVSAGFEHPRSHFISKTDLGPMLDRSRSSSPCKRSPSPMERNSTYLLPSLTSGPTLPGPELPGFTSRVLRNPFLRISSLSTRTSLMRTTTCS